MGLSLPRPRLSSNRRYSQACVAEQRRRVVVCTERFALRSNRPHRTQSGTPSGTRTHRARTTFLGAPTSVPPARGPLPSRPRSRGAAQSRSNGLRSAPNDFPEKSLPAKALGAIMTSPFITILITTYNYGPFIEQAIDSVLSQAFPADQLEILVVDDGSMDDTSQRIQKYGDRIRYLPKPNGGQASALNFGFAHARGEIVCLLDADD